MNFIDTTFIAGFGATIAGDTGTASWGDFNGDGLPDLWQGNHFAYPPMLWLNQGDGTFVEQLQTVMDPPDSASDANPRYDVYWGDQHGAAWADFDNDGDQDLLVLLGGTGTPSGGEKTQLLLNEGGRLTDVAEELGVQYPKASGRDATWFDYDRDGLLDFFHTAVKRTEDSENSALFRQKPNGHFVNVDDIMGAPTIGDFVPSVYLGDLTGDGVLDLVTPKLDIFDGATGPRFERDQSLRTAQGGSDVLIADFDGDLRMDLFAAYLETHAGTVPRDQLFLNSASGLRNATDSSNINSIQHSTQSAVAADFDNDMDVDIFLFNGAREERGVFGPQNTAQPNVMLWNDGDAGFTADQATGRSIGSRNGVPLAVTTADYDRDGVIDMFLEYSWTTDRLYRGEGNGNHWVEIDLTGRESNRDGIGSQIFVTAGGVTQVRDVTSGSHSDWSQNDTIVHFGLARNATIDRIEVHWTNGIVQALTDVAADQVLSIVEERGTERRTGTAGNDKIVGGPHADVLHGGAGDDRLFGMGGNDRLTGDAGNDVLDGAGGADHFVGGLGADTFLGRGGFDIVDYSLSTPDVTVDIGIGGRGAGGHAEGDTFHGVDGIIGTAGRDTLLGNNINNFLYGEAGRDSLGGGAGNDVLWGGPGADVLNGGAGFDYASYAGAAAGVRAQLNGFFGRREAAGDRFIDIEGLIGSPFADVLVGDPDPNNLSGFDGDDTMWGGASRDVLRGDLGADTLIGGPDADTFLIRRVAESAPGAFDRIADFEQGTDTIDLAQIDAAAGRAGNQAFGFIGGAAFSGAVGELRFVTVDDRYTRVEGDVDGDRIADLVFVVFGAYTPTEGDFIL